MQHLQVQQFQNQQAVQYFPYFTIHRVFGNVASSYSTPSVKKRNQYKEWRRDFIVTYKMDISEKIISEVIGNQYIVMTLGDILDLGEEYVELGQSIKRICMRNVYTGRNHREELRQLIMFNINHDSTNFISEIIAHSQSDQV